MDPEDLHPLESENSPSQKPRDVFTSPPPSDIPPLAEIDAPKIAIPSPFVPLLVPDLPLLSISELSQLEEQISKEFTDLAQQYIQARRPRVDLLIEAVDASIKKFQRSESSWAKFYALQVQVLESLSGNVEDMLLAGLSHPSNRSSLNHIDLEADLAEVIKQVQLPLDMDDLFAVGKHEIPFSQHFLEIISLHQSQLEALAIQRHYQLDLVASLPEKNKRILWKQYRKDILDRQEQLVQETTLKLTKLSNEYHGVSANADLTKENAKYYRSVVPLVPEADQLHSQHRLARSNTDSYYDVDNVYCKKNQIEITDARTRIEHENSVFAAAQDSHKIPQLDSVRVRLNGCEGLTQEESDADLALLRSFKEDADEEMEIDDESADSMDGDDESDMSNSAEEAAARNPEYDAILNMNRVPSAMPVVHLNS